MAMQGACAEIKASVKAVAARYMRSIDDVLAHAEEHNVDCAVVDQSRPGESRGVKLLLLASAKKIKHLVVIVAPNMTAEIKKIEGVHQVLTAPVTDAEISAAVADYAANRSGLRPSEAAIGDSSMQMSSLAVPNLDKIKPKLSNRAGKVAMVSRWTRQHVARAGVLALSALVLSYGAFAAHLLSSRDWTATAHQQPPDRQREWQSSGQMDQPSLAELLERAEGLVAQLRKIAAQERDRGGRTDVRATN
jgi:hypothetical protein